ncbi:c-type cytochrome [Steroidobacter agaridevorans]|uniref:c-type cytochrome n=1 Tax=Steroidobacter agaridevorans TaxID=2695856 RepID=UPI00132C8640|nr:cytochrome c [Steroidobacter agaridevorans]GFE85247.1 cytochrome c [Steroidobacter agaridevorans]
MTSKETCCRLLMIAACAVAGSVAADEELDPQPVIEGRQSALRDIGAAFKGITDELKKPTPSLPMIRQYARQIDELTKYQQGWFPAGTGPESDIQTAARPEIWQQPAEFKTAQKIFGEQAFKLAQVADSNDPGAIKAQWQALGKTCKGCHEKFREKDD